MSFEHLGLKEELVTKLSNAGLETPSDIQQEAIPELLSGKDGVIVSPTGTGKTLAYLLPILNKIDGSRREVQAMVLAPTQELAMQIVREAEAYGAALGIKTVGLIGGASLARQLERLKNKPSLIVGTPGRVREVTTTRKLSLHAVNFAVVDETDRLFSLGGRSDVENLLRQCHSRERQTVFVSATRSEAMKDAERKWLKEPWVSDVTAGDNDHGLSPTLAHWFFISDKRDKIDLIRKLVRHLKPSSALLFVNDTEKIGELLSKLRYEGFSVDALYGDTPGRERGEVMQRFRKGRTTILIATDVAARGLDIPGLPLVIQFEPALDADHYVHRAGRTARMGRVGTSITLVTVQERFIIDKLEKQLHIDIAPKMLYEGRIIAPNERNDRPEVAISSARVDVKSTNKPATNTATVPPVKPAMKPTLKPEDNQRMKPVVNAVAQPSAKPNAKAANTKAANTKANRERDRKNKGAPRWLKEKRDTPPKS